MASTIKVFQDGVNSVEDDDCNGWKSENNNLIVSTGQSLNVGDNFQTSKAIAQYASKGDFYQEADGSAADVYVLENSDSQTPIFQYKDGMRIRFKVVNANTGASTVNVNLIGVKNIFFSGAALSANVFIVSDVVTMVYDESNDRWNYEQALDDDLLVLNRSTGRIGISAGNPDSKFTISNDIVDRSALGLNSSNASYTGTVLRTNTTRAANAAFNIHTATSNSDLKYKLSGIGNATCDGSFTGGGADLAEYFEGLDVVKTDYGISVVIDGLFVRKALSGETPIGVIRPATAVSFISNGQNFHWKNKYLTDDYGDHVLDIDTGDQIINPDFDPDQEYIPYENRVEKVVIGYLGQIPIKKGQPVSNNWILMGPVSDDIDMYFVK